MSNCTRLLLFIVLTGLIPLKQFAQQKIDSLQYNVVHYTEENGLPQNSIKSLLLTQSGFLWMTTENGLVRFDGNSFKLYNKTNSKITTNRFFRIYYDYTLKKSIAVTNNIEKLKIEGARATFINSAVYNSQVQLDNQNTSFQAWHVLPLIGTGRKLFSKLDYPFVIPIKKNEQFLLTTNALLFENKNKIDWIWPFSQQKEKLINGNPYDFFVLNEQLFHMSNSGIISIISKSGAAAIQVTGDLLKNKAYGRPTELYSVFWNENQQKIIFYFNKAWYTLEKTKSGLHTQLILQGFDPREKNLSCAYYDAKNQRLFLGSLIEGLYVFTRKNFTNFNTGKLGYSDAFYGQIVYSGKSILTSKGNLFDSVGNITYLPEITKTNDMYCIEKDTKGNVYTTADSSVYVFNDIRNKPIARWKMPGKVSQVWYDTLQKVIWIGTSSGVFYRETTGNKEPVLANAQVKGISCFLRENKNILWIGTGEGCFRLHLDSKKLDTLKGLEKSYVRTIYTSTPGELWFTTYEDGFFLYKNNHLTQLPLDNQKYLATAHQILEDQHGYFWISTNKGLFQASKKELLQYAANPVATPYYLYFSRKDGLLTNEFNGGTMNCAIKLPDGRFSFSSLNGLTIFDPDKILKTQEEPRAIYITAVTIDTTAIPLTDSIHVPQIINQLKISINIPFFGNPDNLAPEYSIITNKTQSAWLHLTNNTVTLSRLLPGAYTLLIRQKKGFRYNEYIYQKITLLVPIPFIESLLFKIVTILILILLIYLFILLRVRHLKRKNRLLDAIVTARTSELNDSLAALKTSEVDLRKGMRLQKQLITSISHDIRTPLRFLVMATKKDANETVSKNEFNIIYQTSQQLYQFTEKMLQFIKAYTLEEKQVNKRFNLHTLVNQKLHLFADIAAEKHIVLLNEIDTDIHVCGKEELLGIIIHNLLDNAIKSTRNGIIYVSYSLQGSDYLLSVQDSGTGMSSDIIDKYNVWFNETGIEADNNHVNSGGLGFEIIKGLLSLLESKIKITSNENNGTTISILAKNNTADCE